MVGSGVTETESIIKLAKRPFGVLAFVLLVLLPPLVSVTSLAVLDLLTASFCSVIINFVSLLSWRLGDGNEESATRLVVNSGNEVLGFAR